MNIEERAEPPRMDRRWPVLTCWNPTPEFWAKVQIASMVLGRAGLVGELVTDNNNVTLYAARRVKPGKKK